MMSALTNNAFMILKIIHVAMTKKYVEIMIPYIALEHSKLLDMIWCNVNLMEMMEDNVIWF